VTYAGAQYWDQYFLRLRESGDDLDWGGRWTEPFLAPLRAAGARSVHFFSDAYLRELLLDWRQLRLDAIQITRPQTGEPFKQVWRGVARR